MSASRRARWPTGVRSRCLPPFRQAPRRLADHLDPVAEVVPGEAALEARFVSERQRHVGDVAAIAVAGVGPRQLQPAAPVERVGVEQRCRADQLVEQRVGLHLLRRPIRKVFLGAELGQLQPAHLDARLLERLGDVDAVVDAGAIIVGADDDLAQLPA